MLDGWIKLWRKLLASKVFAHQGILKLWILCLLKASRQEKEIIMPSLLEPIKLRAGQFITGRDALHYDYHQGDILGRRYSRKLKPVAKTLFRWLKFLANFQNLSIKSYNKYSIVSITNWDEHQENVQQMSNNMSNKCPQTRSTKKVKQETPAFFSLRERYPDQNLLDQVFKAIASTRKSNKVSESVLVAQLQKWEKYPVQRVQVGLRIYLQKDYASQGKAEAYLLGIIRNHDEKSEPRTRYAT